jgi:hypothetical protein
MGEGAVKVANRLRGRVDVPRVVTIDWEAGDDGSVPDAVTSQLNGNVTRIITVPDGDDVPSDYNIFVLDDQLVDIMAGGGADRSGTARGHILFENPVSVDSPLTVCITGQTEAGAKGKVLIFLDRIET